MADAVACLRPARKPPVFQSPQPLRDRVVSTLSAPARAQFQIHFCVLLWGFTAILGKMISLPALPLVWWRMLVVVGVIALLPRAWRGLRAMSPKLILSYAGIGVLVALHWLTFYGAIKLANASVAAPGSRVTSR